MSFSALFSALSKLSNIYLPLHQCQKHDQTFSPLLLSLPHSENLSGEIKKARSFEAGQSVDYL
ncbi:hypothetical protein J2807_000653 [Enterobacter ludwigii]|jgi:hypothetical protein|nr:hypothetical protein [Enterobacter ludwigii]SHM85077.1 hypothetical protein SAMN05428986_3768 [Enterobacter ludwigii]